jgi:hypothetical protein
VLSGYYYRGSQRCRPEPGRATVRSPVEPESPKTRRLQAHSAIVAQVIDEAADGTSKANFVTAGAGVVLIRLLLAQARLSA